MDHNYKYIGKRIPKFDARDKVTGRYLCLADEKYSDCLYGVLLLSPYANAKVTAIDASAALALPGVKVLTYKDAPDAKYNSGEWYPGQNDFRDETLLTGHARYVGDRIALVLAASEAKAREALKLVKVEYEQLPAIVDLKTAADNAALLHEDGMKEFPGKLSFGDIDAAFAKAAYIETDTIYTPKVHHAAIETHCVLALPKPGGVIEIHTPSQVVSAFSMRQRWCCLCLCPKYTSSRRTWAVPSAVNRNPVLNRSAPGPPGNSVVPSSSTRTGKRRSWAPRRARLCSAS